MVDIRPKDLPAASLVTAGAALIIDNGVTVEKSTPLQIVDAGVPQASQAEAVAGTDNAKRVTPLRVAQFVAGQTGGLGIPDALALKANASALGVAGSATNMGTFTGTIIPDNQTAKQATQALETAIEDSADNLAGPAGAGLSGFSHANTYAPGTVGYHQKKFVIVTDAPFNAKGDDATDDTAAINAAIDHVQSNGGGDVIIPKGIFRFTSLAVPLGGNFAVNIVGQGYFSVLKVMAATGDAITLGAWWSTVRNLRIIAGVTRSADAHIRMSGNWQTVADCQIEGDFVGIRAFGVGSKILSNQFYNGALGARRVWLSGGDTSMQVIGNIASYQVSPQVEAGVFLDDNIAAEITNNSFVGQGRPISVSPGNGQAVTDLVVSDNFLDTSTIGAAIEPSGSGIAARCSFEANRSSNHSSSGYLVDTTASTTGGVDGIDILNTRSFNNELTGVSLRGANTKNVRVLGGSLRGKASGATSTALSVGPNVTDFIMKGVSCRDGDGFLGNLNGVFLDSGTDNYEISANDFRNQISASIVNGGTYTTTKRILRNQGFVTDSVGSSSIPNGSTSVVINHGCSVAPRIEDISFFQAVAPSVIGNVITLDTGSITSTQFTMRCGAAAVGPLSFTWKIKGGDA